MSEQLDSKFYQSIRKNGIAERILIAARDRIWDGVGPWRRFAGGSFGVCRTIGGRRLRLANSALAFFQGICEFSC